ncbi:hypothetical protein B0H66DRAFT_632881 [Apodospora peruviana]|uniref:DUF6604 domain-containing protein n=1 Tax=Apodospora peruviana TaxID=516989 RepID=A0AAE0HSW5_9PEZI|nr:hypothetical protein B0H66DRAFT_632881 [Apodospora peruviana]
MWTKHHTAILALFQSFIQVKSATHAFFQQAVAESLNPEVERINRSHKRFIDRLIEAREALGEKKALDATAKTKAKTDTLAPTESKDYMDQLPLTNKFGALDLDGDAANAQETDETEREAVPDKPVTARRKQAKPSKGKGKGMKKSNKAAVVGESKLEDIPLENYHIIQDEEGFMTDYLLAVCELVQQMGRLRSTLQNISYEVAYDRLNSAVAGAVSNVANAMARRTASALFVNFLGGHDSFQTVIDTITHGDIEKAQGMFTIKCFQQPTMETPFEDWCGAQKALDIAIDIKEQFFIYAYGDLLDFVTDFQITRIGKPTKRMLKEIKDWDPKCDLQRATNKERIRWRRAYTLNWLYDLVNVCSSAVVECNHKGEGRKLEDIDWSVEGTKQRRLFGLNEYAGFITSIAMQKLGTDIRKRILPYHVFQLQCLVDSMAVSRGWTLNAIRGHVIVPPARDFRVRRDLDLFLDRDEKKFGHGIIQGLSVLTQLLDHESRSSGEPRRKNVAYDPVQDMLGGLLCYIKEPIGLFMSLEDFFGESFYENGKPPDADFAKVLFVKVSRTRTVAHSRPQAESSTIHELMSPDLNLFFNNMSAPVMYHKAGRNPVTIPDEDVPTTLMLSGTKRALNPATGQYEFQDTDLVRRFVREGGSMDEMHQTIEALRQTGIPDLPMPTNGRPLPELYHKMIKAHGMTPGGKRNAASVVDDNIEFGDIGGFEITDQVLLEILKADMLRDICGLWPLLGFNSVWGTSRLLVQFLSIEDALKKMRNRRRWRGRSRKRL